MAIITRLPLTTSEPAATPRSDWVERVVTAATACLAVLIVATIAVLMGMA
jgi:hypothetical protein